jgi:hypothetical protein
MSNHVSLASAAAIGKDADFQWHRARERERSKKAKEKSFDEADSTFVSANKQEFAKQGRRSVFHYQRN